MNFDPKCFWSNGILIVFITYSTKKLWFFCKNEWKSLVPHSTERPKMKLHRQRTRLLFFRHIPLSATLYKILVMDFHTWWRYHYFCFTGTAQQSTLSTYFVFGELSDDCWAVPVKQLGWQWPLVSSSTTKICKSKILRKKCSLAVCTVCVLEKIVNVVLCAKCRNFSDILFWE